MLLSSKYRHYVRTNSVTREALRKLDGLDAEAVKTLLKEEFGFEGVDTGEFKEGWDGKEAKDELQGRKPV